MEDADVRTAGLAALTPRDRTFLAWFVLYYLFGFTSNFVRTSDSVPDRTKIVVGVLALAAVVAWIGFFVWSVVRARYAVGELGFVVNSWRSRIVSAVAVVIAVAALLRLPSPLPPVILTQAIAAIMVEEIVFRPLLIPVLSTMFSATARPRSIAVIVAAAIWAFGHLPSKPLSQVFGIFVGGLVFNVLYVSSGSNIVGIVLHAVANTGGVGAVVTLGLCLLLAATTYHRRNNSSIDWSSVVLSSPARRPAAPKR